MPATARNPYTSPSRTPTRNGTAPGPTSVFGGNQRYAVRDVPESTDPEYTTGYSPPLKAGGSASGEALPDAIRIGTMEPPVRNRNSKEWQARVDSDFLERHSVEEYKVRGPIKQAKPYVPPIPEQVQDIPITRPTQQMSPAYATTQRPWHIPRNAKDALGEDAVLHFSLANHKRRYEIMGQRPQGRLGVNTYRAQPRPWDEKLFTPPQAGMDPGGIAGNRTWRL